MAYEFVKKIWDTIKDPVGNIGRMVMPAFLGYGLNRLSDRARDRDDDEMMEKMSKRSLRYQRKSRRARMKDYVKFYPKITAMHRKSRDEALAKLRSESKKDRQFTYRKLKNAKR